MDTLDTEKQSFRIAGDEFWELHRRLGECYRTDVYSSSTLFVLEAELEAFTLRILGDFGIGAGSVLRGTSSFWLSLSEGSMKLGAFVRK